MSLDIRPFCEADAIPVAEIFVKNIKKELSKHYPLAAVLAMLVIAKPDTVKELASKRRIFVGTIDGKVVGTATLYKEGESNLQMVYVAVGMHKQGIGRQLVERVEKIAREEGISVFKVDSSINATGFYEKLGFVLERELYSETQGRAWLMTKQLFLTEDRP